MPGIERTRAITLVQLKNNQPTATAAAEKALAQGTPFFSPPPETGHGRVDQRHVRTVSVTPEQLGFPHAAQVVEMTRESTKKKTGETSTGRRLFVLSEPLSARDCLVAGRTRWGVENKNHHPRDGTWLEDKTRAAAGHTAANLTLLRGLVLVWWRKGHSQLNGPAVQRAQPSPA